MSSARGVVTRAFGNGARGLSALLLSMVVGGVGPALAHDKTDIVVLVNGDRYQGEIKMLKQGSLSLDTDAAGTISLKWSHVAQLVSRYNYQVRSTKDDVHCGVLDAPDRGRGAEARWPLRDAGLGAE